MTDAEAPGGFGGSKPELRVIVCGAAAAALPFETDTRRLVAIDMPGDGRYTRSSLAAAAGADLALVMVDARAGVPAGTRRQLHIAALSGIRRAILAIDRMDLADCGGDAFAALAEECRAFARELGIDDVNAVPLPGRAGEEVLAARRYDGPTLIEALDGAEIDRGDAAAGRTRPTQPADQFAVDLIWTGAEPMLPGRAYRARFAGASAVAQVTDLTHRVEIETLRHLAAKTLAANEIGYCKIALDRPVPFATGAAGAFELADRFSGATVGAGALRFALRRASSIAWQETGIDKAARARARPRTLRGLADRAAGGGQVDRRRPRGTEAPGGGAAHLSAGRE